MLIRSTISLAVVLAAIAAGIAVASSGDDSDPASTPDAATAPATSKPASAAKPASAQPESANPAKTTKLKLKSSPYGDVVFANGFAMYIFTRDQNGKSKCYGACAEAWPPLKAKGDVIAGSGIKSRLLGTTKRRDGSRQVTYKGQPLYGYIDDPRGEVLCHDVAEFGGTWLAVLGSGDPAP
jgi:predicted lipoprotein with Yx(FWY)xxD motif